VAEVHTYRTLKGKSRNHVLLATAIVEVRNKSGQYVPCRALLDSGSQSHFITEKCVQLLRIPRTQTHTSVQGISNVNTATQHSVSIHLKSRHTHWHTTLDLLYCLTLLGPHHLQGWTQAAGRFPRTSTWLTNNSTNQETLTSSLELTYSTR